MAREKRRKETELHYLGRTNLGFDSSEIESAISKDKDIETLSKNLTEADKVEDDKVNREKKKKRIQDTSAERIKNDLEQKEINKLKKKSIRKKTEPQDEKKVKPKKRKSGNVETAEKEEPGIHEGDLENQEEEQNVPKLIAKHLNEPDPDHPDRHRILGVFVHYSDCLKLDFHVLHPVVKISLINLSTGKLLAKSGNNQQVTSYYEGEYVTNVIPLMTQPFDFRKQKSIVPRWEELLVFNDSFDYFMSFGSNLGIFFEIVDFVSMSVVNNKSRKSSDQGGWHRVAWAFLKPVPSKYHSNINRTVRLQLYKPQKNLPKTGDEPAVWFWWSKCPRVLYPSSIYVTIEPVNTPEIEKESTLPLRSMKPTQPEYGSTDPHLNATHTFEPKVNEMREASLPRVVLWTRLPGQLCKVPDGLIYELETPSYGARCLKFSLDGQNLATACPAVRESSTYSVILIHCVATGELKVTLEGHKGQIYDLDWHRDGLLLSASGDCTARIWSPTSDASNCLSVLQHPSYVYTARFHPSGSEIIATGGFDHVVRIWQRNWTSYKILHELVSHRDYVTCMEFDIDGQVLFTGDHEGAIRVWETQVNKFDHLEDSCASVATLNNPSAWNLKKRLDFKEIIGCQILALNVHPGGRRLLVQCRSLSHPVAMIDLKLNVIMQTFTGCQSFKKQVSSCISPCGTFVIASGQDGAVYIWNADNGAPVHVYDKPLGSFPVDSTVVVNSKINLTFSVSFHPFDHIIAFAGLGQKSSSMKVKICVYKYSKEITSKADESGKEISETIAKPGRLKLLASSLINDSEAEPEKSDKFRQVLDKLDELMKFTKEKNDETES